MSILLKNGVVLPDIPQKVMELYPHICIMENIPVNGEYIEYIYMASEMNAYANAAIANAVLGKNIDVIASLTPTVTGSYYTGDYEWYPEDMYENGYYSPIGSNSENQSMRLVWSNADVNNVSNFDMATGQPIFSGIYFLNSIQSVPSIPTDLIEQWPYWVICNDSNRGYALLTSPKPFGFAPIEITTALGYDTPIIASISSGNVYYCEGIVSDPKWVLADEGMMPVGFPEIEYDLPCVIIAANHDIKVVEAVDAAMNVTWGEDVYFKATVYSDAYIVPADWMKSLADQARRLSGQDKRYTRDEMLEFFKSLSLQN